MKRKTGKGSAWVTGLLVLAALTLALWPAEGRTACARTAAEICTSVTSTDTTDCDGDGFSDYLECTGFNTGGTSAKHYYGYSVQLPPGTGRDLSLDPTGKDLFVALARSTDPLYPTRIPADAEAYVATTLGSQLGIVVHFISPADFVQGQVRQVTLSSSQKGVIIGENAQDSAGADKTTLGLTSPLAQTPDNNALSVTVFTARLETYVATTVCPVATYPKCVDSTGVGRQNSADTGLANLYSIYHRQNIIHELSHAISLAALTGSHQGVNTTSPFNNSIMSQYVFTKAYKAVTKAPAEPAKQVFYIPSTYDPSDKAGIRLRY